MGAPTTARRRYYDTTGGDYESSRYADSHMERYRGFRNRALASLLDRTFGDKPLSILEVGCGTGLTLQFLGGLARTYALHGIDVSDTMIRQAAEKAPTLRNPPRLALGDADRLPFANGQFDVVYATRFIHQFPHATKQRLWAEFKRVCRADGLLVVEFYARPYHQVRYYLGGAKGRTREDYLSHFPARREVDEIVNGPYELIPLRMAGSRVVHRVFGQQALERLTQVVGQASGGLLMDEYFVAARNR